MYCFAKFCRLCLKESSALIDIFYLDKDNGKIVDKMKFLRPELISSYDGLPTWICPLCRTQVNRSYNLLKKWIQTHETLQKYINKFKMIKNETKNVILNIDLIGVQSEEDCDYEANNENNEQIDTFEENLIQTNSVDESQIALINNNNVQKTINDGFINSINEKKEETIPAEKCNVGTQTKEEKHLKKTVTEKKEHPCEKNNVSLNISSIQTENKVIEDLIEIVKMSEDMQNIEEIDQTENNLSDKTNVLEELIEIAINDGNNSENISETNIEIHSYVHNENNSKEIDDSQKILESHDNILEKAIEIAEISESTDTNLQSNKSPVENKSFFSRTPLNSETNLDFISETATDTCDSIFSNISNELHYNSYSEEYFDSNRTAAMYSNSNAMENNCRFMNYSEKVLDNIQSSVDLDAVRKISGYLQDSYPESPANEFCNLNDKVYNENCDTIIDNLLQSTTNSSLCSQLSERLNNTNLSSDRFENVSQSYTFTNATDCENSNQEPSANVQILSMNNSWNNVNAEVLSKEHFALLESVEKNLENLLLKNVQSSETYNEIKNITNASYSQNYLLDSNSYSPAENIFQPSVTVSLNEENSPTIKKDFSFSEDSNGNEISSKKSKLPKKRSNTLEGKFYQLFQDMEIASRHCNTPVECVVSSQNCDITYLVDRNNSTYSCKSCNITYKSISAILDHGQIHGTTQDLKENEYLLVNVEKPEKSVKIIVNHEIKKFFCKKCDKNYSEFAALYRHVAVHVSNQRYFCDECGKSFPVYRYLSLHKLTHNRIRMYACKLCSKTFRAKDTLRTHEIVHHENNDKPYICELCGKGFVIEQYLKYHMSKHNKETGRICHICGKILKNEELCYKHIKEKHLVISFKECEICHKTFHNNRNLKAHMIFHGTKDFKCDECDKEFFFSRDLKNHKLLHTGSKPHKCEQCGKNFRVLGALYKHKKTHKAKPHVCGVCQKGFHQLRSLQVHERVHSGLKPYKCEECDKSYVHINVYYQHMKKFHPEMMAL